MVEDMNINSGKPIHRKGEDYCVFRQFLAFSQRYFNTFDCFFKEVIKNVIYKIRKETKIYGSLETSKGKR